MKNFLLVSLFASASLSIAVDANAQSDIVIEAESTSSQTGQWQMGKEIEGFEGKGYIEFTGNTPKNGPPNSPLDYTFTVQEAGLYYLHIRCAKETIKLNGEVRNDLANDCYVRVAGDFGAATDANEKGSKHARLKELQTNNKFFGGKPKEFAWSSGSKLDIGGNRHKKIPAYQFKAGQTYTLTVSGRSQKFKIDQLMFSQSLKVKTAKNNRKKKD